MKDDIGRVKPSGIGSPGRVIGPKAQPEDGPIKFTGIAVEFTVEVHAVSKVLEGTAKILYGRISQNLRLVVVNKRVRNGSEVDQPGPQDESKIWQKPGSCRTYGGRSCFL